MLLIAIPVLFTHNSTENGLYNFLKLEKIFCILDDICQGRAILLQITGGMIGNSTPLSSKVSNIECNIARNFASNIAGDINNGKN